MLTSLLVLQRNIMHGLHHACILALQSDSMLLHDLDFWRGKCSLNLD